jgi:cell division protein FtsL
MEALQQRYEELTKRHQEAVSKGESSKARRMDRLTKVFFFVLKIIFYMFLFTAISRSY